MEDDLLFMVALCRFYVAFRYQFDWTKAPLKNEWCTYSRTKPSQFTLDVDWEPRMHFIRHGWLEEVYSWALDERRASWVLWWQVRCVCCHLRFVWESILQTWDQFWVAMEVTHTNFEFLLPRIEEALTNCHFCAIDAEFSGLSLTNPRWVHVKKTSNTSSARPILSVDSFVQVLGLESGWLLAHVFSFN